MLKHFLLGSVLLFGGAAQAQIVPDATLGSERSSITPRALGGDAIGGGAIRGANLFHSFSDFNIGDGAKVYFANPTGIQNILTRVTGKTASNINGTLGVDGRANLFLLNPNGIIFGQNARLDVGGSFVGTTANAIGFGTQGNFSATNPSAPPLLTVQPSALLFTQVQSGEVVNQGASLLVPTGQSLLLVGGNVKQESGVLFAIDGRVELGGLSAPGSISLNQTGGIWSLAFPEGVERSNVSISNPNGATSGVFVSGNGGGSIAVTAKDFTVDGKNILLGAGIGRGKGAIGARGGDITINATDSVTLSQKSFIGNSVQDNAIGDGGNIVIKTGTLLVKDGSIIDTFHSGQGNGGNILITAKDSITISGTGDNNRSGLNTFGNGGQGNTGNIQITAGSLSVKDGGYLETASNRPGNSGSITVNARDAVVLDGFGTVPIEGVESQLFSTIGASLYSDGIGNSGNIQINTGTFSATNGGNLSSSTLGRGNAGNISINARDSVIFDGSVKDSEGQINISRVTSSVFGVGNGGNIQIATGSLALTGGGNIETGTAGQGNSGSISIVARNSVKVDGESQGTVTLKGEVFNLSSGISSDVTGAFAGLTSGGVGNSGEIRISTGSLSVTHGGIITSNTSGQGNAGNIAIDAHDRILVEGSGKLSGDSRISSQVLAANFPDGSSVRGSGQGGNVKLTTGQLVISNGGYVSSGTLGDGNAGNISIAARDSITINGVSSLNSANRSGIFASANPGSTGQGGEVQVRTGALSILAGGALASSNRGTGNGGSIDIQANSITLKDSSAIQTLTTSGNGGNIFLTAKDFLLMRRESSISASATANSTQQNSGNSGNLSINATNIIAPLQENNTIAANATKGNGGNVSIATQGLYGIEARSSAISGLSSITASSDLGVQGNIAITQPEIQPTQGTIELPIRPIPGNQLSQICPRNNPKQKIGVFVSSGRGSAPPNPIDALSGSTPISSLATIDSTPTLSTATVTPIARSSEIIEAQGWIKSRDGTVELVAHPATGVPSATPTANACPPANHNS